MVVKLIQVVEPQLPSPLSIVDFVMVLRVFFELLVIAVLVVPQVLVREVNFGLDFELVASPWEFGEISAALMLLHLGEALRIEFPDLLVGNLHLLLTHLLLLFADSFLLVLDQLLQLDLLDVLQHHIVDVRLVHNLVALRVKRVPVRLRHQCLLPGQLVLLQH